MALYMMGWVKAGWSCSLCPQRRQPMMSTKTSFLNLLRNWRASRMIRSTRTGSSAFTWKIGAPMALATSVQYVPVRASIGVVVKPIWLLATTWMVPQVVKFYRLIICSDQQTTPWPASAASPWMMTLKAWLPSWSPSSTWVALLEPMTTGFTASRCEGLGRMDSLMVLPLTVRSETTPR